MNLIPFSEKKGEVGMLNDKLLNLASVDMNFRVNDLDVWINPENTSRGRKGVYVSSDKYPMYETLMECPIEKLLAFVNVIPDVLANMTAETIKAKAHAQKDYSLEAECLEKIRAVLPLF